MPPQMDGSCMFVSRLYFSAQRRQCASCKAVAAASSWTLPRQLFHSAQNHPRILCVLASSRSEEATRKGMDKSFQRPGRQTVDLQEIDALAAASGSAKALALGRKYSRCVNGAARRPTQFTVMCTSQPSEALWLVSKHPAQNHRSALRHFPVRNKPVTSNVRVISLFNVFKLFPCTPDLLVDGGSQIKINP